MALRLLATFPFIDVSGNMPVDMTVRYWYPGVGLLCSGHFAEYSSSGVHVVTLDGVCRKRMSTNRTWSWWPSRQRMLWMSGGYERMFEPKVFAEQQTHPDDHMEDGIGSSYVKLLDRRVFINLNKVYHIMFGDVNETQVAESDTLPVTNPTVRPGRSDKDIWCPGTVLGNGAGCFYDTETRKIVSPVYNIGMECEGLVYVPEFNVLVSGHNVEASPPDEPWQLFLKIWSFEVNPTQLLPVEVHDGVPKSGQVVTYRTRLLGDQDDPAEGEFVSWLVEGKGLLLDYQTKTDADGYAFARVQYLVGETGESKVLARVAC
jgi:hypothetical protein